MSRPSEAFQARVGAITSIEELGVFFEQVIGPYGLTHFAIGELPQPDRDSAIWITNWPAAWVERYAINGYAAEDIAVHEALRSPAPRNWAELKALNPGKAQRILATAAEFGWHDGFVVPVHAPDGERGIVATMGGALQLADEDGRAELVRKARGVYARAKVLHASRGKGPVLTRREHDALNLVAQGSDDAEIGRRLGITRASAHAYVERAKKRLGASTRAQAVALAMAYGLISAGMVKSSQAALCLQTETRLMARSR